MQSPKTLVGPRSRLAQAKCPHRCGCAGHHIAIGGGGRPQAELSAIVAKAAEVVVDLQEVLEAVDFVHGEKRKEVRKGAMAKRYKVDRTARLLSAGGFGKFLGRRFSAFLQEDGDIEQGGFIKKTTGDASFDPDVVNLSPPPPSEHKEGTVGHFMEYVKQQLGKGIGDKRGFIFKTLTKRDWASGLGKFESFMESAVYIVGQRCNSFRFGPEAFPPARVCMLDLGGRSPSSGQRLRGRGAHEAGDQHGRPSDLRRDAGRSPVHDGVQHLGEHWRWRRGILPPPPPSYLPIILYPGSKDDEAASPLTTFLVYTFFSASAAASIDPQTWQAVLTFNQRYLATVSANKVFNARADLVEAFSKSVEKARGTS